MRQLHPVSPHEKFVASGVYTFFRDHRPSGLIEYWNIYELPDGSWVIRVDRDGREYDGRSVLVEAWRSWLRRIERFDIHRYGDTEDQVKSLRGHYTFFDDHVEVGCHINQDHHNQVELALPMNYLVRPFGEIFTGFILAQLADEEGQPRSVFSNTLNYDDIHAPVGVIAQMSAGLRGKEQMDIAGRAVRARLVERHFAEAQVTQGHPIAWIDEHDVLLKYQTLDYPSLILTQYARRPDLRLV